MSNLFRDKGRLSDRLRDKTGEEILQSMRDEFDNRDNSRMFFEPPSSWTEPTLNSPFTRAGFPFDNDRSARSSSRLQKHLDDIAARHPEFADHLRPDMAFTRGGQRTRQPSGSSSGVFSSGEEDGTSDTHSQTSEEAAAKQPQQEAPHRKLPQYGLRNTVDLGGAAQRLEQSERNQRSWSAPPEGRTAEEQPKRFVSRIEIQPQPPSKPQMQEEAASGNPGPSPPNPGSANPGKPPLAPKPQTKSGERVIPIFVEGRSEPIVPKGAHAASAAPQPPPKMQQKQFPSEPQQQEEPKMAPPFPERHSMDYDDFADFPHFPSRSFGESPFGERFSRPEFPSRQQRHFGEPFWAQRPSQQQPQPPPSPPQKRPMAAQSPPTKRATEKPQPKAPEQPPKVEKPAPPPPPPVNDPIAKVAAVQKDVEDLMKEIEAFSCNSKSDKQYLFLDEMLTRNLIKLDVIETDGKENIRQVRKEAIRSIQRAISMLESKVQKTEACNEAGAETEQAPAEEMQVDSATQ